jgi:hypothetical protein
VAAAAVLEADLRRACEAAIDVAGETSLAIKVVIRIVSFGQMRRPVLAQAPRDENNFDVNMTSKLKKMQ